MLVSLPSPVALTFDTGSTWADRDVSTHVPAGATHAIVRARAGSSGSQIGFRRKGSTDDRHRSLATSRSVYMIVGLDASRAFQLWTNGGTGATLHLIGYLDGDHEGGFTNLTGYGGTANQWATIDLSAQVPAGATVAFLEIDCTFVTSNPTVGLRPAGSSDNRTRVMSGGFLAAIPLNEDREIEFWRSGTNAVAYLIGYTTAPGVFHTNAVQRDTTLDTWEKSTPDASAVAAIHELVGSSFGRIGARDPAHTTFDPEAINGVCWAAVGADDDGAVELYRDEGFHQVWEWGYFTEPSGSVEISVDSATHGHTAGEPETTQASTISVDSAAHGHAATSPQLSVEFTLAVDDASHAHAAASPTLTQAHALTVDSASHGHAATSPTLTQAHALAVDGAVHAQTATSPALAQASTLTVDSASHGHTATSPALSEAAQLAVADATHAHTASSPSLTQAHVLAPDDAQHGHTAGQVTLLVAGTLAVDDAVHAHTAGSVDLTQAHVLTVQGATHSHAATSPTLSTVLQLAVADAAHVHVATEPALTQAHVLAVASALHAHMATVVQLTVPGEEPDTVPLASATFRTAPHMAAFRTESHASTFRR